MLQTFDQPFGFLKSAIDDTPPLDTPALRASQNERTITVRVTST